jgi:hypothetical protein
LAGLCTPREVKLSDVRKCRYWHFATLFGFGRFRGEADLAEMGQCRE